MSKQRDKAETLTRDKHGGSWATGPGARHGDGRDEANRKAHRFEEKRHKRARRRLDAEIIKEEVE